MKKRTGTILLIMLFVAFLSVLSGCGEKDTAKRSTTLIQAETTTAETSTPTSTPTPTATPTPTPTPTPSIEDVLATAPDISGLAKEIQNKKVVYIAASGNEYGIEVGEFAGEYNPNVSVEGTEVGAVALEPEVVTKILNDELAKIPEGEDKMKVVIPLDITEVTKETEFNIEDTVEPGLSEYLGKETHIMIVEFNNPLTFINTCIDKNQFNTVDQFIADIQFKKENGETITLTKKAGLVPFSYIDPYNTERGIEDINYIFDVVDQNVIKEFNEEKTYTVGEKTDVQVESILSIWFNYDNPKETTPDDLLKLSDGTVVFTYPQASVGAEATSIPKN